MARQRGFDYVYGPLIGEIDYFTHEMHGQRDWYRNNQPLNEKGYVTTLLGQDAVRLINQHDPNKPLFLYLAFTSPHTPYQAPKEYLDRYSNVQDPQRRAYSAMITAMDDQIGKVIQALEARNMRDNTIIVFHSDNGGVRSAMLAGQIETKGELPADNGPFRDGKGSLYEGGTRVASLINWPGKIKPAKIDQPMHVVDMFPTLVKLAGGTPDKGPALDGLDLWPTIADGKPSPRQEVVYNVEMFRGAVRNGDWKLFWRTTLPSRNRTLRPRQGSVGEEQRRRTEPGSGRAIAEAYPDAVDGDGQVAVSDLDLQAIHEPAGSADGIAERSGVLRTGYALKAWQALEWSVREMVGAIGIEPMTSPV